MKLVFMFVFVFSVAVCDIELTLEAADGENVNIRLEAELERANRVRITFKRENEEEVHLIAQSCSHNESCSFVETPGVLLDIKRRILILQHVSSNDLGLYEAQVFFGNNVFKIKATLVNKPAVSPTEAPLHTSTINPPNSSEHQWWYALLILPVIALGLVVCFFWRTKCMKGRDPAAAVEEARETPAVSRLSIFKKMYRKRNCSDCAAVSFKACRGDPEDQLVNT